MKHPPEQFVCVVWDDSVRRSDEVSKEDIAHAPTRLQSYGWILRDNERGITISPEYRPSDGMWRESHFIHRGNIVDVIVLSLTNKRNRRKAEVSPKEVIPNEVR